MDKQEATELRAALTTVTESGALEWYATRAELHDFVEQMYDAFTDTEADHATAYVRFVLAHTPEWKGRRNVYSLDNMLAFAQRAHLRLVEG